MTKPSKKKKIKLWMCQMEFSYTTEMGEAKKFAYRWLDIKKPKWRKL